MVVPLGFDLERFLTEFAALLVTRIPGTGASALACFQSQSAKPSLFRAARPGPCPRRCGQICAVGGALTGWRGTRFPEV